MRPVIELYGKAFCGGNTSASSIADRTTESIEHIKGYLRPIGPELRIKREFIIDAIKSEQGATLSDEMLFCAREIILMMFGWNFEDFSDTERAASVFLLICLHDAHLLGRCEWGWCEEKVLETATSKLDLQDKINFLKFMHPTSGAN